MKNPEDYTGEAITPKAKDGSEVKEIMTPDHLQWKNFEQLLGGPEGCNFRKGKKGPIWTCGHGFERPLAGAILKKYFPQVDIAGSLAFFESHGGYCDCGILPNVEDSYKFRKRKAILKNPTNEKV
jgi:hypothetical protein